MHRAVEGVWERDVVKQCPCCAGYVAIGFTDVPHDMGPADVYIGFLDNLGNPHVVDAFTMPMPHPPDAQQDAIPISGSLVNGVLSITFLRRVSTGVCGAM